MRAPCPSCGQNQVAPQGLGKAACGGCGARYYSLVEATGLFVGAGLDPGILKQLVAEQSFQRHDDPLWEGRLKTIVVKGMEAHFSMTGQAIWMPDDAAVRLSSPFAAPPRTPSFSSPPPTPTTATQASSFEDPMASLGLGASSHGLPQENRASSGPSLELDSRPRGPPPSLAQGAPNPYASLTAGSSTSGAHGAGPQTPKSGPLHAQDFAAPLPPPPGEPMRFTSESAFAVRPKGNLSHVVWLVVKLAIAGGVVGGGYYAYQEVRAQLVWPRVALDWDYTVVMPGKPPPQLSQRSFRLADANVLTWYEEDTQLNLVVVYADVGLAHEDFVRDALGSMFGERFQIDPPANDGGLRFWPVEAAASGERPAAKGRMWIDEYGRAFITMATAPDVRTLRASNVGDFVKSLRKQRPGLPSADEG